MQTFIHYFFHFGFPLFIALVFYRKEWKKVFLILIATMLVDVDHLLATPIFETNRCSIGFHYLHSFYIIPFYFLLLFFKETPRIIGVGLLVHMMTDLIDCLIMFESCKTCYADAAAFELMQSISDFFGF